MRAIADLDDHEGSVSLNGVEQKNITAHEWRQRVALLSAETCWWLDTVGEHFQQFSEEDAGLLGFKNNVANWQVSRLSSGEKQRLGLLRLLENEPDVLLLDEPTANLDYKNTLEFEKFVTKYVDERPACAIWVSHDIDQLKRISQQQYEIKNGNLYSEQAEV